jgi:hypothetical protein
MAEVIIKWLVPIVSGFLLGLLAIAWLEPKTPGGNLLILATFMAIAVVTSAFGNVIKVIIRRLRRLRANRGRMDMSSIGAATIASPPTAPVETSGAGADRKADPSVDVISTTPPN